jgi:hypothetical protein
MNIDKAFREVVQPKVEEKVFVVYLSEAELIALESHLQGTPQPALVSSLLAEITTKK